MEVETPGGRTGLTEKLTELTMWEVAVSFLLAFLGSDETKAAARCR